MKDFSVPKGGMSPLQGSLSGKFGEEREVAEIRKRIQRLGQGNLKTLINYCLSKAANFAYACMCM